MAKNRYIDATLRFIDQFSKPMGDATRKLANQGRELQNAGKQISNVGGQFESAGKKMTAAVTVPLVGLGAAAVKTAADFDAGMSKVQSIAGSVSDDELAELRKTAEGMGLSFQEGTNATETAMNMLSAKAKQMGAITKFSATESADAFSYMAMAGWKTEEMLNGIEGVMYLAGATGEDLATTSDIVTDALTAFGMTANDTNKFVDLLAQTANNANTDVYKMGETFKYVAPAAGALGYSADDVAVAVGLMANSGIKASQAGTSLNSWLTRMAKPTKESGTAMEALGISITNADGSMKSFDQVMVETRGAFQGLTESQKAQYAAMLAGKTGMSGLLAVVNASEGDFAKLTSAIDNSTGAAKRMYDVANDNLNGRLTELKSKMESIAITMGEKLMPHMEKGVEFAAKLADKFANLSDEQQGQIIKWGGIAAAAGPAVFMFGKTISTIGGAVSLMGTAGVKLVTLAGNAARAGAILKTINLGSLTGALGGVGTAGKALATFLGPVGTAVAVVAALAAGVYLVYKNWDKVTAGAKKAAEYFKNLFSKNGLGGDTVKKMLLSVQVEINTLMKKGRELLGIIVPPLKAFGETALQVLGKVAKVLMGALGGALGALAKDTAKIAKHSIAALGGIVEFLSGVFSGDWNKAWEGLKTFGVNTLKSLGTLAKAPLNLLKGAFSGAFKEIGEMTGGLKEKLFGKDAPFEQLGIKAKECWDAIKPFVDGEREGFSDFRAAASEMWGVVGPILEDVGKLIFDLGVAKVKVAVGMATGCLEGLFVTVKEIFNNGILRSLEGLLDFITGVFTGNWQKAWGGVRDIFGGAFSALKDLAKAPINAVIGIVNGAIKQLNKVNIKIPTWVPGEMGGKSFGVNLPTLQYLYSGTKNWRGGPAMIHDRGAEIVDLPSGSRVYPHDKSLQMARQEGAKSGQKILNIAKLADQIIVREEADIDRIIEKIADILDDTSPEMA